ncbi:MAG: ABC transporter permease [Anaerolineales bacterium]
MGNKFWYVAMYEYRKHVFQKKFILAVLSVPLVLGVSIMAGFIASQINRNEAPVGYVDLSGVLTNPVAVPEDIASKDPVEIIPFSNEDSATAALENDQIQAYYLLPEDYQDSREVTLFYIDKPGENAQDDFFDFLQANVSAGVPEKVALRAQKGFDLTVRSVDGKREFSEEKIINLILPVIFGFIFTFVLTSGSGYLSNSVTEEKESRTIEVLATSMSANQFIAGKVLGIVMVIFTQLFSWVGFFLAAFFGARAMFDFEWLQSATIDLNVILMLVLVFIPGFFFFAGIALTISSTVTESSEGQQMIGLISMPVGFSYWFAALIVTNPNSPLSIGLSIFPFTAPTLMPIRLAFSSVPLEQFLGCVAALTLSAAFTIWLAARAYELGMMQYGKRLRLGDLLRSNHNGK